MKSSKAPGREGGRYQDGQWVTVLGLVTAVRKKATKSSSQMAFVTLEDMYGALTALVFSRPLEQYGSLLYEGSVVEVSGKLSFTEEKEPELVCQSMAKPAEPTAVAGGSGKQVRPGLYLRLESESDPRYRKAMQYIAIFDGGLHPAVPHLPGHGQTAAGPSQIPGGYEPPPAACPARAAGKG